MSDKGGEFVNQVMEESTRVAQISHVTTKGYNLRESGITEKLNRTVLENKKIKINRHLPRNGIRDSHSV